MVGHQTSGYPGMQPSYSRHIDVSAFSSLAAQVGIQGLVVVPQPLRMRRLSTAAIVSSSGVPLSIVARVMRAAIGPVHASWFFCSPAAAQPVPRRTFVRTHDMSPDSQPPLL